MHQYNFFPIDHNRILRPVTGFLKAKKETLEGGFGLKHLTEIVQIDSERYLKTGLENVGPNKILREIVKKKLIFEKNYKKNSIKS